MKRNKLPNVVILLILTLITAVFTIIFNIYSSFTAVQPSSVPEEILSPVTPSLDTKTIEIIKNKIYP